MINGRGETEKDALVYHDNNLIVLMMRCRDVGICLNTDNMILRQDHVPFLGHIITADGLKPDPDKVKAIDDIPRPIDIEGVQRFNGFVNYLARFLPKLSGVTEPTRYLTRKDVSWNWSASQENVFLLMKELVKMNPY